MKELTVVARETGVLHQCVLFFSEGLSVLFFWSTQLCTLYSVDCSIILHCNKIILWLETTQSAFDSSHTIHLL